MDVLVLLLFGAVIHFVFGGMVARSERRDRWLAKAKERERARQYKAHEDLISPPRI